MTASVAACDRQWASDARDAQTRLALIGIAVFCGIGAVAPGVPMDLQLLLLVLGVVTIGMPHGAMDHRVAELCFRRRVDAGLRPGGHWRVIFGVGYIGLALLVIVIWQLAPMTMLVAFLGYSAVHFGLGDQPGARFDRVLAHGALPILLPAAVRPAETASLLGVVAGAPLVLDGTGWLVALRLVTSVALLVALLHAAHRRQGWTMLEVVVLMVANVVFAPLLAFALYFVLVHSTRHLIELADWLEPESPRRGLQRIVRECLPLTFVTVVLMAIGFMMIERSSVQTGVIRVLFITLSALTVPHMLLTELAGHDSRHRHDPSRA